MRKNDIIQIGSYAVQLLNTIHDSEKGYQALLFFDGKNSIKTNSFEGKRYNLENGYYIFIRSIIGKPEESVLLKIKKIYTTDIKHNVGEKLSEKDLQKLKNIHGMIIYYEYNY